MAQGEVIALLLRHELVSLERIAEDGTRVRARAGASSFRRPPTLETLLAPGDVRAHVEAVLVTGAGARQRAAARRAADVDGRVTRIEQAIAALPEILETTKRSGAKDKTPRASTRRRVRRPA